MRRLIIFGAFGEDFYDEERKMRSGCLVDQNKRTDDPPASFITAAVNDETAIPPVCVSL